MIWAFTILFTVCAIAPWLTKRFPHRIGWILGLVPFGLTLYFASFLPAVMRGEPVRLAWEWVPVLFLTFSVYIDGLALLFALLISGIGTLIAIYAGGYLHDDPRAGRFHCFLLLFMGAMLGVVLADNLITLFIFWELTSFSSYLLIGHNHEREQARTSALQALLVTGAGGLFLMAGFVLWGLAGGSFELSELRDGSLILADHPQYRIILFLVLIGAFTKSAQAPFHFWLPRAMEAPTPASAYLHSSTMVKAGIYLLARTSPSLGGTTEWTVIVTAVGAITMLMAACMALKQTVLKPLLAYTTVGALGAMTMLLGMGHPGAVTAAMAFLLAHALYKATLFMVAGAIDHETGEKDTDKLGGLRKAMPLIAGAAMLAALSMCGLPPFIGFIGKEILYEAVLETTRWPAILTGVSVLASMLFVVVAFLVGIRPFIGATRDTPKHPHDPPPSMWLGPVVLSGFGLFFGLFPGVAARLLVGPSTSAVLNVVVPVKLSLWHGINWPLVLSVVTLLGAVLLYLGRNAILRRAGGVQKLAAVAGAERVYFVSLNGLLAFARWQTRMLQNGRLRYYMMTVIGTAVIAVGYSIFGRGNYPTLMLSDLEVHLYELMLAAVILASIIAAVAFRTRLAAIAALGVTGYSMAVIFVLYGAPDLAMTQVVIETLTLVLLVLAFYHLPPFVSLSGRRGFVRDALFSLAIGGVMAALVLFTIDSPYHAPISNYFLAHAVEGAHGRNIVNVILVDFRALDTLGEIIVLALAGVGGFALLKLHLKKKRTGEPL